jgi:hypothetical protein
LRVYFTPLTPFGFSLQGFLLPRSFANSSLALCRPAVAPGLRSHRLESGSSGALCGPPLAAAQVPLVRLHGFAPLESTFCESPLLANPPSRAPLGLFPLQGLPFQRDAVALHHRSPRTSSSLRSARLPQRSDCQLHLEVSFTPEVALPLSRPPSPPEVRGHLVLTIQR